MLKLQNENGVIVVDENVIANIVSAEARNCFGIAGMTSKNVKEEIWSLFRQTDNDRGVEVRCENNEIMIDLHIMVSYGVNIPAITDSIVHKITYTVEEATGFPVCGVNVFVDSVNTK